MVVPQLLGLHVENCLDIWVRIHLEKSESFDCKETNSWCHQGVSLHQQCTTVMLAGQLRLVLLENFGIYVCSLVHLTRNTQDMFIMSHNHLYAMLHSNTGHIFGKKTSWTPSKWPSLPKTNPKNWPCGGDPPLLVAAACLKHSAEEIKEAPLFGTKGDSKEPDFFGVFAPEVAPFFVSWTIPQSLDLWWSQALSEHWRFQAEPRHGNECFATIFDEFHQASPGKTMENHKVIKKEIQILAQKFQENDPVA